MKRCTIAAALAAMSAGAAQAQNSLTLYGLATDGVTYVSNRAGRSVLKLEGDVPQANRWGIRGTEDLGGGLRTVFNFEGGLNINTGAAAQGGSLFGRRAFVGLSSNRFGTLIAGNNYDFVPDYVTFYTNTNQFGGVYSFHLGNDIDRLAGEPVHNVIRYESPNLNGVDVGAMYGFGNAGTSARVLSVGLKYSPTGSYNAPYSFGAAFTKTDGGSTPSSGITMAQVSLNAKSIYTVALGGLASVGKFSFNGVYTYTNSSPDSPFGTVIANVYEGGVSWRMTPVFKVSAGLAYINERQIGKYQIATFGLDYRLSKRTDVFTLVTWQHAFGGASVAGNFYTVTPYSMSPSMPSGAGASSSRFQTAVHIGIRHVF